MPEGTEQQRKKLSEAKQPPPPEPVNVAPFPKELRKYMTAPPPEPVAVPPFSHAKPTQQKDSKQATETEGKQ